MTSGACPFTVTDDTEVDSGDKLFDNFDKNDIVNDCYKVFRVALCRLGVIRLT
jgi:hypothetical protein